MVAGQKTRPQRWPAFRASGASFGRIRAPYANAACPCANGMATMNASSQPQRRALHRRRSASRSGPVFGRVAAQDLGVSFLPMPSASLFYSVLQDGVPAGLGTPLRPDSAEQRVGRAQLASDAGPLPAAGLRTRPPGPLQPCQGRYSGGKASGARQLAASSWKALRRGGPTSAATSTPISRARLGQLDLSRRRQRQRPRNTPGGPPPSRPSHRARSLLAERKQPVTPPTKPAHPGVSDPATPVPSNSS